MKIAVVGSREFKDLFFIEDILDGLFEHDNQLITGGAKGVDKYAENFVKTLHFYEYEPIILLPDWDKYGKKAGFLRNQQIVNQADIIIAFWDGKSKGTKHSIDLAIKANKPIDIYVRN